MATSTSIADSPACDDSDGHRGLLPGIALCGVVTVAADALDAGERAIAGKAWLEALVLAILIGTAVRTV